MEGKLGQGVGTLKKGCWNPLTITNYVFLTAIWLPPANFGPMSRGQPRSPDSNHCIWTTSTKGHQEPRNTEVGSLNLAECIVGFELETFWVYL